MKTTSSDRVRTLAVTAMLCAVAYLVTFVFHFKVMFLTFDLKDAVLALSALLYGPSVGVLSAGLVASLEFVTVSDTGLYGLVMNFLSSAAFAGMAGLVYKYKRDFAGAVMSMVTAALSMTTVMVLANYLITPFYMGVSREEVGALIPTLLLPFNACKAVMNAAGVLLLYKPITTALRRTGMIKKGPTSYRLSAKSIATAAVAVLLIAAACVVLTVVLGGYVEWF